MGLAASSAALLAACGRKGPKMQAVPAGATVLALGDSLTFGYGATPETSYPTVLARLTGWNVVNAGVTGETAAQILERTPGLLQEHKPALVLVCAGGNDFLQKKPEADTRATLRAICQQCKDAGAQVLLVAVPALNIMSAVTSSLSDHALYESVATEMQVPLHAKGWSRVLGDSSLRSDQVHANAKGYERFANELRDTLQDVGLLK
ncbi:lipoprotein [Variovorax sp. VNK109]|uniref:GDSL-type esterase/lipase family protein n=1 Tax=Variovorax sp. VNK109 TaxID=3400919 RepID=UPI003C01577B